MTNDFEDTVKDAVVSAEREQESYPKGTSLWDLVQDFIDTGKEILERLARAKE
jgi:hypothetical protein